MTLLHKMILLLAFMASLAAAREVEVRYFLEDNSEHAGTFLKLERDTVVLRVQTDSVPSELRLYKLDLRRILHKDNDSIVDLNLSDYVFPDPVVEAVVVEPPYPPGKSTIKVVSDPPECRLYINGKDQEVLTPYTISNIKEGKYELSISKYLKDVDWWGSEKVKLKENETLTVKIKLEKPRTMLSIISMPEAAEIYLDEEEPSLDRMPSYYTDVTIKNVRPKILSTIHLRKIGYHDTTFTTEIKAFMPNMVYVEMEPIQDNLALFEVQNEFDKKRKKRYIGRGLLWSSIAPIVGGGVLWYLAERDWQHASDLKKKYAEAAFASDKTDQFIKDNKDYNDKGDIKMIAGASLGALGLSLAISGIVLQF